MPADPETVDAIVAVSIARLEEQMKAMRGTLDRIERGMGDRLKGHDGDLDNHESRIAALEGRWAKLAGALLIVGILTPIAGAFLARLIT